MIQILMIKLKQNQILMENQINQIKNKIILNWNQINRPSKNNWIFQIKISHKSNLMIVKKNWKII